EHLCADVNNYDMRRLPATDVLWASPICTEVSPAGRKAGRRTCGQLALQEYGPIARAGYERTRATFHDVIRATEVHRYKAVIVENVPDVVDEWELFDWWVQGMCQLRPGYHVQFVSVSSAHIGDPTNLPAPQWRDRAYFVFTQTGIPLPDLAPRPLAWCPTCEQDVDAVQAWKRPGARQVGRYRRQYVYRCPRSGCRHAVIEPYVRPAATVIDWSDVGQRIGDRARPLAAATLRRIEAGLRLFADPRLVVNANHDDLRAYPAHAAPLTTRTTKIGDVIMVAPMLTPCGGTWNDTATPVTAPMRTRTARDMEAVVTPQPFLTVLRSHATATSIDEPMRTVATGNHHYLTVPPGAFYTKNYGGHADPRHMAKPVTDPLGTITASSAGGHHALVVPYYRTGRAKKADTQPLDTVTTNDRFALVTGQTVRAEDCHYRMVRPRESLRGQRFPDSYIVHGNQGEQTMQAGNAVSANVAQWLGHRIAAVLA
ncbi:MAG TPA: DNA cytosine methyltransferase, partial [Pseudonocardiaceae bacterium]|nr:DNA cytosine methyltransferase [Pseudonocardiaceae bacterium]